MEIMVNHDVGALCKTPLHGFFVVISIFNSIVTTQLFIIYLPQSHRDTEKYKMF